MLHQPQQNIRFRMRAPLIFGAALALVAPNFARANENTPTPSVLGNYPNSGILRTRSAATYAEGVAAISVSMSLKGEQNATNAGRSRDQVSSTVLAEFGVNPQAHIGISVPLTWRAIHDADAGTDEIVRGPGDVQLYGKYRLIDESEFLPAISTDVTLKLPTGNQEKGLSNGQLDTTVAVELSKRLGVLSLHLNPEYVFTGGTKATLGPAAGDKVALNTAVIWHLLPAFVPVLEENYYWWGDAGSVLEVGGGALWKPFDNVSMKLGAAVPVHQTTSWRSGVTSWLKVSVRT